MIYEKEFEHYVVGYGYHSNEDLNKHSHYMGGLGYGVYTTRDLRNTRESEYMYYVEYVKTEGERL